MAYSSMQAVPRSLVLGVLWLLSIGCCHVAANTTFTYEKNGVRLVGGDATKGRLEVLPKSGWATSDWTQVCDDRFSDDTAQVMCNMLGYKFGRNHYDPKLNFPTNATRHKVGDLSCYSNSGFNSRRLLHGGDDDANPAADASISSGSGALMRRVGRSLLSPWWGNIDVPKASPYACRFRLGTCNPVGSVAAIQCSNRTFPPAPSPPPSPPLPPPPPPAVSNLIRIIGSVTYSDRDIESNLCATDSAKGVCEQFARVEIQVDSPNKTAPGKIWAPVCNITNSALARDVARLACEQRFQERLLPWLPNLYFIMSEVSPNPLLIPRVGRVDSSVAGNFNRNTVRGWVTISSGNFSAAAKLQDLKYRVSSTTSACARNAMLAISCGFATNDGAIP